MIVQVILTLLFFATLVLFHYKDKLNNWTRLFIALFPLLLNGSFYLANIEIGFINLILPFIFSFIILEQSKRTIVELLPYGILLLPIEQNLKIIGFSSCIFFNFNGIKDRTLPILKIAIIAFLTLVDKTASFKYLFCAYLIFSTLVSTNEEFAIVDGLILSLLLTTDIQHISQTLNVFLIFLVFLLSFLIVNKKNIFKLVFLLTSLVCVLLNLENMLMAYIAFYYFTKSFIKSIELMNREVDILRKYLPVSLFSNIALLGLFTLSYSVQNIALIIFSTIAGFLILLLEFDSLVEKKINLQWYELLYSLLLKSFVGVGLFYFSTFLFEVDNSSVGYSLLTYLLIALIYIGLVFNFDQLLIGLSTKLNLGNQKRVSYLETIFSSYPISSRQETSGSSTIAVPMFSLSYRTIRAFSLIVIAIYFLVIIFKVVA